MTATTAVRWWPVVGLVGLAALGLAVGKASTPLDDWFKRAGAAHRISAGCSVFTDGRVLFVAVGDRVGGGVAIGDAGGSPSRSWRPRSSRSLRLERSSASSAG